MNSSISHQILPSVIDTSSASTLQRYNFMVYQQLTIFVKDYLNFIFVNELQHKDLR